MYGVEWLIVLAALGLGVGGGYLLAGRTGRRGSRVRQLEGELESTRRELADYRAEVVAQFSDTARKFQTLNDAYTDLHRQLARSSSLLCGDSAGPLLTAPAGHQDLLQAEPAVDGAEPAADEAAPADVADSDSERRAGSSAVDPYEDDAPGAEADPAADATDTAEPPTSEDIRVAEPGPDATARRSTG